MLSGRASEFERDAPFAAVVDALAGLPHGLDDGGEQTMRHVKHRAVRALLEDLARDQPLVLALDDLHWADGATLDLVGSLVDRPVSGPVMLVLGHRPFQLGSQVADAIASGTAAGRLRRITLGALSLSGAASLLGGSYSTADVAALHEACGGNPYLLQQLGKRPDAASLQRGLAPPAGAPSRSEIDVLLATELAPLSPDARAFAERRRRRG